MGFAPELKLNLHQSGDTQWFPLRNVALSLSSWLPEHLPINQHCVFHKPGQSAGLEEQRDVKDHVVIACGNGNIPQKREQC